MKLVTTIKALAITALTTASMAHAASDLTQNTVQGQYLLQAYDIAITARISLKSNLAVMQYADMSGNITCKGTYQFDDKNLVLVTNFPSCGKAAVISHKISLAGKSVADLKAATSVDVELQAGGQTIPGLSFKITKEK